MKGVYKKKSVFLFPFVKMTIGVAKKIIKKHNEGKTIRELVKKFRYSDTAIMKTIKDSQQFPPYKTKSSRFFGFLNIQEEKKRIKKKIMNYIEKELDGRSDNDIKKMVYEDVRKIAKVGFRKTKKAYYLKMKKNECNELVTKQIKDIFNLYEANIFERRITGRTVKKQQKKD